MRRMATRTDTRGNIVMLCSLDTKGRESAYLRQCIEELGFDTTVVNIGYGGDPTFEPSVSADEVASAAGSSMASIRELNDTGTASTLMMQGAVVLLQELIRIGQCDGVIAFGGASNTTLSTGVMNTLPTGIPKLMVSSSAAMPAYAAQYFGFKDITIMHAVVDMSALNDITKGILRRAAGGICGMAAQSDGPLVTSPDSKLIAVTTFRFSEHCSQAVMTELERLGYTAIPFHAQGIGESAMESMLERGLFKGVVDVVPAGLSEYMLGGNRAAREDRLEGAGRAGIPMVVSTSGFDMISCGPIARRDSGDALWEQRGLAARAYSVPDRFRVEARTTADEVADIGRAVAERLNKSDSPACVIVPTRGWSTLSIEGEDLWDPAADAAFVPALREAIKPGIPVIEVDAELNSVAFAKELAMALHRMIEAHESDEVDSEAAR